MQGRRVGSLVGIVLLAVGLLVATVAAGNKPLLGLDLQGGVEVVLEPVDTPENLELATQENLDRAVSILRKRVDAIGVAEPDITAQTGDKNFIIVQLPGIEDQDRAVSLVGQTAQLRFRPVLTALPAAQIEAARAAFEADGGSGATGIEGGGTGDSLGAGDGDATDDGASDTGATDDASETEGEDETGFAGLDVGPGETAMGVLQDDGDTEAPAPERTIVLDEAEDEILQGGPGLDELLSGFVSDPLLGDDPNSSVVFDGPIGVQQERYLLGPSLFDGSVLDGAQAVNVGAGQWIVNITFNSGSPGIDDFNEAAELCFGRRAECPTGRLAIVLDGVVESAANINAPVFTDTTVTLSRGDFNFTAEESRDIALVVDFGALPLAFADPADPDAGLVRTVSATLGTDSLNAGLIAGAVGVFLVALYMIWYYRLLGIAAMLSLGISATLLWVIVSFLGSSQGLALTLAGVVGLIVSIGVSLDSNVVYFEHLKEEHRRGRPLSSAVDGSFPIAFNTIFWANLATLIGAAILYFLTVGSVKGFALMLGIASILDLVATYFFMAPLVRLLADRFADNPRTFGIRGDREGASA